MSRVLSCIESTLGLPDRSASGHAVTLQATIERFHVVEKQATLLVLGRLHGSRLSIAFIYAIRPSASLPM